MQQDISKIISSPSKESKPDKEKQLNLSPKNKNIGSLSNTNSETLLEQQV